MRNSATQQAGAIKHPVKITDTTFRDAHQSSCATRLRLEDMEPIAADMDRAGFFSVEMWGGATFDVATRFLEEDPWERVRRLKKLMPKTPFQMLLRGQNLVGYRNYPDDVVRAFVAEAAGVGIDIFRVFDAVNDEHNVETAFQVIKDCGKHVQAAICYSTTGRRLGGPIFKLDYFVKKALSFQGMGADSLCIKDMAGLIAPYDAYELVKALKSALKIPVHLHSHYTSGMASMSYLLAIEAGVDGVDTTLAPLALRSSQPAIEPLLVALEGTARSPEIDVAKLIKLGQHLENVVPKYCDFMDTTRMAVIDTNVLVHQVPGGMLTNLVSQLREADALDKLEEVFAELPRTRKELGYPPLVTPTSQIVGSQAVSNVLFGRYKMISKEIKDYVFGLYGHSPAPVDPEVQKIVLKGYERGETPMTGRAADMLEPELGKAKESTKGIAKNLQDVLIYALFPTTGMQFLKRKYGLSPLAAEAKPVEPVKKEEKPAVVVARAAEVSPPRKPGGRAFHVYVGDEYFRVEVAEDRGAAPGRPLLSQVAPTPSVPAPARTEAAAAPPAPAATAKLAEGEVAIAAPMPGIVIRYEVKEGDRVTDGQPVVIFEAMKMQNTLTAPKGGVLRKVSLKAGDKAAKGDVLAVIG
ncbi:MAG: pyruvate carboxylase subunit B [Chloroflexi bacterium]|nr:pyruvate carboxylase subunit B [Chloroflexota bacterium]